MSLKNIFTGTWVQLYAGKDGDMYRSIKEKLDTKNIRYRGREYNAASRIAMQSLATPPVPTTKGPNVTSYALQADLLSSKKLDSYYIEVKKKDLVLARKYASAS